MPNYHYKAIDDAGKLIRGTVVALGEADIEDRLTQRGLTLIKSKPIKGRRWTQRLTSSKVKPRILIEFYHRFSQTLEMGLPILTGLEENAKAIPSKRLKKVIEEIKVSLEDGNTLHESMGRFEKVFQKLDLAIIKIGEQSGLLPQCMKDLADFREWRQEIRSIIKGATIYPSFVMVAIVAVIGVWVGYVLPQMAGFLNELGVDLPRTTQIVLSTSFFIQKNWPWIVIAILAFTFFLYIGQKTKRGGILFHKYLLASPLVGGIMTNLALARLSHYFATMHKAGMMINEIFEMLTDNVLGNRYLQSRLVKAFREVQLGQTIASGLEKAGGFPSLLVGAVRNGESTGTLDDSLKRLGDYYDGEVKKTVHALVKAIEPATILLLGGVFGLIVLSILLPLYDVLGQVGKAY